MSDLTAVVPTVPGTDIVDVRKNDVPDLYDIIESLGGKAGILTTLPRGTQAERIAVASAVSNSTPIAEELGKTINVVNVVVQATEMDVEVNGQKTGEVTTVPRTVLVDDKGDSHHTMSASFFRDVRNMLGLVGIPDLTAGDKPIAIKVMEEGKKPSAYYTLKYVS